jgi:hypothetical protein
MERKKKTNTFWIIVVVFQSILILFVTLWAITQKVEADKQTDYALIAQKAAMESERKAKESERLALMAKDEAEKAMEEAFLQKKLADIAKEEAIKQKELSDKSPKRKK